MHLLRNICKICTSRGRLDEIAKSSERTRSHFRILYEDMEEFYIRTWNVYNVHPIGHLINFLCPSYKKKRSFCYTNGWSVSNSCRLNFGKIENSSTSLLILQYFSNPMMPYYCSCVSPPE